MAEKSRGLLGRWRALTADAKDLGSQDRPSQSVDHPGHDTPVRVQIEFYRDRLMAERYAEPGLEEHSIGEGSEWDFYAGKPTAHFRLHNLEHLRTLTESYRSTGEIAYARKADELAHRWLKLYSVPDDSPAWHGHPAALRAGVFAYLHSAGFCPDGEVSQALVVHAEFLADDANYAGAWNHGLDQNIALLQASRALGNQSWAKVAARRIEEAVVAQVDIQGVVTEQAASYSLYVHERLGLAAEELRKAGASLPTQMRRLQRIPTFLAWATRPDGVLVQVGDSKLQPVDNLPGTALEYPATLGRDGVPPAGRSLFYDDGWGFIRSGWGEDRPLDQESHLTLRYGTFRRIHGHRDHTSILWFTGGRPVLEDPGFSAYGNPEVRDYEQWEHSHSVVTVDGARGGFLWQNGTELLYQSRFTAAGDVDVHLVHLGGFPYKGVTRTRSVLHIPQRDLLLVRDSTSCEARVTAHQRWQFGASFEELTASDEGTTVKLSDAAGSLVVRQLLPVDAFESRRGETSPQAGWVATAPGVRSPAFSLRFSRRGSAIGFVTVITAGEDPQVELGAESMIRITMAGEAAPLIVRYDPAVGFVPVSRAPSKATRWDHVAE